MDGSLRVIAWSKRRTRECLVIACVVSMGSCPLWVSHAVILYWCLAIAAVAVRRLTVFSSITAYGRLRTGRGLGWAVSKSTGFRCFYGTACLVCAVICYSGQADGGSLLPFAIFALHVCRRLAETLWLQSMSGSMTPLAFAAGCSFYVAAPVSVLLDSQQTSRASAIWCAAAGAAQAGQLAHHVLLQRLRGRGARGTHAPPRGGLFRWLVAPHYTCEVAVYVCVAAACGETGQHTALAGAFSFANLLVTATEAREWLREHFGSSAVPPWRLLPCL